jgi:hypothetical protein
VQGLGYGVLRQSGQKVDPDPERSHHPDFPGLSFEHEDAPRFGAPAQFGE